MLSWLFLRDSNGDINPDTESRYRMQVISDVYRAMQTRLDGYRQSAGAIFLAVVAAMLTLDATTVSTLIKAVLEPAPNYKIDSRMGHFALAVGLVGLSLGVFGAFVIHRLGVYYAEMTSIVFKIDENNKVFEDDIYLEQKALFPRLFMRTENVSRDGEPNLPGWYDPSIKWFWRLILIIGILQGAVGLVVCRKIVYGSFLWFWPIW